MKTYELRKIDLADLRRLGLLRYGCASSLHWSRNGERVASINFECWRHALILNYRVRKGYEDWRPIREEIPFSRTRQNFGGDRLWFICISCGRRCRAIYGGEVFRCRKCYGATYPSQYEDYPNRLISRAQDLRMKLGASGSMDEPFPRKPKWMRWKTYHRLEHEDEVAGAMFWAILGEYDEQLWKN